VVHQNLGGSLGANEGIQLLPIFDSKIFVILYQQLKRQKSLCY
jgi:hypothetical protein